VPAASLGHPGHLGTEVPDELKAGEPEQRIEAANASTISRQRPADPAFAVGGHVKTLDMRCDLQEPLIGA
jgi:hypothetical protein